MSSVVLTSNETGAVDDPDTGFQLADQIIDQSIVAIDRLADILSLFLRVYLTTSVTILLSIFLFYLVIYLVGSKYPVQYGTRIQALRTRRVGIGIFALTMFMPILYLIMWISTGSETPGGRGLPDDGVFGTTFEDWVLGPIGDPTTDVSWIEEIIGSIPSGLQHILDIIGIFSRIYLMTTVSLLISLAVLFGVLIAFGKAQKIGEEYFYGRTFRAVVGLFLMTLFLPVLYLMVWIGTGGRSESADTAYDFSADGVFGTGFEDWIIGPEPGASGYAEVVALLGRIIETYQFTLSIVLLTFLVFLIVVYSCLRWPKQLGGGEKLDNIYRGLFGFMMVLTFIPIMYLFGWIASGVYRPDETLTRVAPQIELPYDVLFGSERRHPFFETIENTQDPLAAMFVTAVDLQLTGLFVVGLAAIISGAIVWAFFSRTSITRGERGIQIFRGGVIVIIVIFMVPSLVATIAFIGTGDADYGVWGQEAPELGAQCETFEGGDIGDWEVTDGQAELATDPWAVQLDGTMEQELPQLDHGHRYASFSIDSVDSELEVRFYDDDEQVFIRSISEDSSFSYNIDGDFRVEIESDQNVFIDRACVGVDVGSDPQLAMAQVDHEEAVVLRDGFVSDGTIYNVGETHSVEGFEVGYTINGTGPHGDWQNATQYEGIAPLRGGQFVNVERDLTETLHEARATENVELFTLVDPHDELPERTTVPNRDSQSLEILYAHLFADVDVEKVAPNETRIDMLTYNDGNYHSAPTHANVTITEGGEVAHGGEYVSDIPSIDSESEYEHPEINHVFRSPGHYQIEKDIDNDVLPMDTVDTANITFIDSDLHANITEIDDEVRVSTSVEFVVEVRNEGNDDYDGDTNAYVDLVDESGETQDTIVIDLPEIDEGSSYTTEREFEMNNAGEFEVHLDADDPYWPYGTTDTETFESVGPSLSADTNADDIQEFQMTTSTVTITNDGTDFVEATEYTATLTGPDGNVVNESNGSVPSLDTGEQYTTDIVEQELSKTGDYDIEVVVHSTELAEGDADSDVFEVLFTDLNVEVDPTPVDGEDAVDVEVLMENHGTTESEGGHDVEIEVENEDTGNVVTETVTFGSIDSGDDETITTRIELEDGGNFVVSPPGEDDGSDEEFEHEWPDLAGHIEAVDTEVLGTGGDIETEVENVGGDSSSSSTADVVIIDDFGMVAEAFTITVPALNPGETSTKTHTIEYPEPGDYTGQIDVEEINVEENTVDTTEVITVQFADLRIDVDSQQDYYIPEDDIMVDVTIDNEGNVDSVPNEIESQFQDRHGIVANSVDDVGTIEAGESETTEVVVDISDTGEYDVISEFDPEEYDTITDEDTFWIEDPTVALDIDAENIYTDQSPDVTATITNTQSVTSEQTELDVELTDDGGEVLEEDSADVPQLSPGESTSISVFENELSEVGEYGVDGELTGESTDEQDSDSFLVQERGLDVDVNANNVFLGEQADTTVVFTNNQDVQAPESTFTADLSYEGSVIEDVEFDVPSLSPGESHNVDLFDSQLDELGQYEVDSLLERDGSSLDEQQNYFDVVEWDLKGDVDVTGHDRTPEASFDIIVSNVGEGESDSTTADVELEGPDGDVVYNESHSIPEISGGSQYTERVDYTATQSGEHTASIDVHDESNPEGTTDEDTFMIEWPMYAAYISTDDEVESNTVEFDVEIINYGSAETWGGEAYVDIYDEWGNEIETYAIDVPEIESGGGYTTTVDHQFETPGEYDARILADEGAYNLAYGWVSDGEDGPEDDDNINDDDGDYVEDDPDDDSPPDEIDGPGDDDDPTDSPGDDDGVEIVHGNLVTDVRFLDFEPNVETETDVLIEVENVGNAQSDSTTVDVEIEDRYGDIQYTNEVHVDPLAVGETQDIELQPIMNTDGENEIEADVDYPEFPIGTVDTDTTYVVAPDLRTEVEIEDTELGEETDVRVEITNHGEMLSDETTLEVYMYNSEGQQVVEEFYSIEAIEAGETAVVEYTQLIAVECWRTEMSCEPGAEMDSGEYLGVVDLDGVSYAPEGTESSDTFYVEEGDD